LRKLYNNFRKHLTSRQKGQLTKLFFILTNRPKVKEDNINPLKKFPNGEKGGLIISADFEMAWAWRYNKSGVDHLQKGRMARENLPKIIEILECYNIPITFATVGHLFLEQCKKGDHDWMARIPYFDEHWKFTQGDWYDQDPYSNYIESPEWYASDLIQNICRSKVRHEIGTHTFSHIDFSYKNCPLAVADDEIKMCVNTANSLGISLKSIVFPGGTWGNIEIIKKYGIQIYRRHIKHDLAYPYRDEFGVLVSPSSGCLEYNIDYNWTPEYFFKRLMKYITKAIKTNTVAHFWFHPSLEPFFLKNIFCPFLDYVSQRRAKGDLWIGTMEEIAAYINSKNIL
jgi:peptidoglycan/xylan/chitin deacetylase (PgdA/CDA1 family)